jgi:glyceraldehyde 3-phosphate dehydrogenase
MAMTVRVGINGFGRIGRSFLRCATERPAGQVEVVAINELAPPATMAHLLRHDSTYGTWNHEIALHGQHMMVDGRPIRLTAETSPVDIDWKSVDVDVVLESTGRFRTRAAAAEHLVAGARKVLISAPGKNVDATIVVGVNDADYDPLTQDIVSAASCTTNCLAPMVAVLNEHFDVQGGLMTTIHGYTNDQVLLDTVHKDLRRARSAAVNLIPTSTGAAKALGLVVQAMAGRLEGIAVRVPIEDGSLTDLTVELSDHASVAEVNAVFAQAARDELAGILRYSDEPIVSRDIIGDPALCVFDALLTQSCGRLVKVFGWYDNEWGYTNRLVDLAPRLLNGSGR